MIKSFTTFAIIGSRPVVGSSKNKIFGSAVSVMFFLFVKKKKRQWLRLPPIGQQDFALHFGQLLAPGMEIPLSQAVDGAIQQAQQVPPDQGLTAVLRMAAARGGSMFPLPTTDTDY